MGRPPIGKTAMTDAERMRRYRLKHGKAKPVTKPASTEADVLTGTPAEIANNILRSLRPQQTRDVTETLTRRIAAIKADCAACHGTGFVPIRSDSACGDPRLSRTHPVPCDCSPEIQRDPVGVVFERAEEEQKQERSAHRKATELARAKAELAKAKARIAALEAGRGPAEVDADVARLEAEITELRDENYAFRVELEAQNHIIKTRNGGGLTKGQYAILQQCCHPDNSASPETRAKGIRLLNQLRYVLCDEATLPSMDERKFHISFQRLWVRRQHTIKEAKKSAKRQRRSQPKASPRPPKDLPKT